MPDEKPVDQRRGFFTKITSKVSITGVKNLVGSIFRFDSLLKVAVAGGLVVTGATVGESADAWDIIDTEPRAIEVIAIVQEDDGAIALVPAAQAPSILTIIRENQDAILGAVLDDAQTRIQIGALLESIRAEERAQRALLEALLANQVPTGPPGKVTVGEVLDVVEEIRCLLRSGRPCPQPPESITSESPRSTDR